MNGKKSKKLRRLARQMSGDVPEKHMVGINHDRRIMAHDKAGDLKPAIRRTVQAINTECVRSNYQHIKRMCA